MYCNYGLFRIHVYTNTIHLFTDSEIFSSFKERSKSDNGILLGFVLLQIIIIFFFIFIFFFDWMGRVQVVFMIYLLVLFASFMHT